VIRRFAKAFNFIDGVVGVQAAVTIELESSAVKFVGAGFGDDINDGAAGVAEFGGICVGIDLELLYRVFAELVGSAGLIQCGRRTGPKKVLLSSEPSTMRVIESARCFQQS